MRCSGSYPDNPLAYTTDDISPHSKTRKLRSLVEFYASTKEDTREEEDAYDAIKKGIYDAIVNGITVAFNRAIEIADSTPSSRIATEIARVRDE